jgi:ATP-binding cassette, subfamily B, bacterial MsbA
LSPAADAPAPAKRRLVSPRPLARLLPRFKPYTGRLIVAAICMLIAAALGLAFPRVVQSLLDSAFEAKDRALLTRVSLGLVLLFAVQALMNFVQVYLLTGTTERVVASLRASTFAHIVRLSPQFFTERRTGELTSRLSSDLTLLQQLCNTWVSELSRQVLLLLGGVTLLALTHTRLMLTVLAVVPVVVAAAFFFGGMLRKASTGVQDKVAEAMGAADEAFSQIRTVQGFSREAEETRRYGASLRTVVDAAIRRALLRALFFGVVGFIAFAGVVAVLYQGGTLVLDGVLTAGQLVSFLLYAITVAAAVGSLASLFGNFQEAIGASQRVFELLDTQPTVAEPASPTPLPEPLRGEIDIDHVSFRYAPELPSVVDDLTLHITPGETVALVGPSGAGKTTLASLLPRFWDVTDGAIRIDGIDIRELSFLDLRGTIGLVPQDPALFSGTIRENIAYAFPRATQDMVKAAADAAHATEFIDRLPNGFDTTVGERGVKLSGGQRQRIALARVFLKNPAIVILDEATSSLDTESERLVEDAMLRLLQGRTTLIIAHRLSTVQRADRLCVLDRGRMVEMGTHHDLLAREGLYARLHRQQFREDPMELALS